MAQKNRQTTSSQVMELQQLIAGPLIATIEADSLSSQRYLDYLMKIAFESYDPATGKTGKLRMLTFSYKSRDINGERMQSVHIPVVTMVPLPLLQVQEADFDFDIKILDALSESTEEHFSLEEGKSFPMKIVPTGLNYVLLLLLNKEAETVRPNISKVYLPI